MKQWKRIDNGLYQRFDDGKPQNVYIDRVGHVSESGKTFMVDGWMWGEKVNGKLEAVGEYFGTLREAKMELMDVEGYIDAVQ
jgi:hypothetical protein